MKTSRLNITLPTELVDELDIRVQPRQKSQFIATLLRERLKTLRDEQMEQLPKEGYQVRNQENQEITQDFISTDSIHFYFATDKIKTG